jgi:O-Antigen ligase
MNLKAFFNAASFSFILFGYGVFAIFITDSKQSQVLTIPYRAIVLLISLYFIYVKFFGKKKNPIDRFLDSKTYFKSRETIRMFPLITAFCIIYLFRFFNDVYGKELHFGSHHYYFTLLFLFSWIPSISFLMIDPKKSREYLRIAQLTLLSFGLIMLVRLPSLQAGFYYSQHGRLSSEALNPISLGVLSGSLIVISTYIILRDKADDGGLFTRFIPIASIVLALYFLFAAASRGPIISTGVCLCILFISSGKKILYLGMPIVMALLVLIPNFILPLLQGKGGSSLDRLTSVADPSAGERRDFISISLQLFSENWHNTIVGYGVELPKYGYPHNIVLESFLATGVIGGCLFSFICLISVLRSVDLVMSQDPWGWVGLLYVQTFIIALLSGSIYGSSDFWYLLVAVNNLWNKKDYANIYSKMQQRYFQNS